MRILLIEDNYRLSLLIVAALKANGFVVDAFGMADDGEEALRNTHYDALVLDLGLPDRDGMTLLRSESARRSGLPVLVLTARDSTQSLIDALNGGADDYIRKPFVMEELVARLRALMRRPGQPLSIKLSEGNVTLDTTQRRASVSGAEIEMSRKELAALEVMMQGAGRVVSKARLEESLYGFGEEISSNAIEVLVHRLRKRLASAGAAIEIHTLRGIGYVLSGQRP